MRVGFIVALWIALGFFYYSCKNEHCDPKDASMAKEEVADRSDDTQSSHSINSSKNHIIAPLYAINSSQLDIDKISIKTKEYISTAIADGHTIEVTGYAYEDEINPDSLALVRAATLRDNLKIDESSIILTSEVHQMSYRENGIFVAFDIIQNDFQENVESVQSSNNRIVEENKRLILFHIGAYDKASDSDQDIRDELNRVVNLLSNNFRKVNLVSYYEDRAQGEKIAYDMENSMIRYGLSPIRIDRRVGDRSKKDRDQLQLIIMQ